MGSSTVNAATMIRHVLIREWFIGKGRGVAGQDGSRVLARFYSDSSLDAYDVLL